ncbi:MAG: beta-propeller fold lactonase family protein [Deltaproteobacteria bacterium]|nr:beta-propeller fold lactonase family protein [Deltaproteobacteria bacterium]
MRSSQRLGSSLTAVLLLLCGCGGSDSVQPPSALRYTTGTAAYTMGVPIVPNEPTNSGGAVTSYSVSPALPPGLSMGMGTISGTPTAVSAAAGYTVTASNAAGSTTATLTITVNAGAAGLQFLPNMSQWISPLAPQGSQFEPLDTGMIVNGDPWLAGHAVTTVVSPDGNTLLVLTSGYNRVFNAASNSLTTFDPLQSNEYVFVYDISTNTPIKKQVLQIPTTYNGIVFDPSPDPSVPGNPAGTHFYVTGCAQDVVHTFTLNAATEMWAEDLLPNGKPALLPLSHGAGVGLPVIDSGAKPVNAQVFVYPCAAGVAISKDGQTLAVANYYNDSISVFTGGYGNWTPMDTLATSPLTTSGPNQQPGNLDLRPGKSNLLLSELPGIPGGEYPFWVEVTGDGSAATPYTVYVSSIRDREIDVVDLSQTPLHVTDRIAVKGQPNKMTLNKAQTRLYVAEDQSDTVDVIDTTKNAVVETIPVIAPPLLLPAALAPYTGANTNGVTLSPDETQLYVANGNLNSIAVVALGGTDRGDQVVGLIPTGWYPSSVSFSADGTWAYVVNMKSPTGANPGWCYGYGPSDFVPDCFPANQYNPQLTKAGLQSFPRPTTPEQLATLTAQVATNNHFASTESADDLAVMKAVRAGVQHVIFIIKENRTYDQVLGDLKDDKGNPVGNGEPTFTQWGQSITPNQHQLALNFVTLDNFMATSEVSYDGWPWTTSARAPDVVERQYPIVYGFRALSLDSEGMNRSVNVAYPTVAGRQVGDPLTPDDPDLLAGQTDTSAPDGPNNEVNTGYLWDAALRANLTVRNYGFFVDVTCYNEPICQIPLAHDPASTNTMVAYPTNAALAPYTDPYFRGFDNSFPDYYRYTEWEREFDANYANGGLPSLSLVRFMHDHTGNFDVAIDLVDTPELMQADDDYAVGLLVQKIANSPYAQNTLIFIVEDDAQDGADHVDSHRTIAFVAGAYVKQHAVVSTAYNTIDFVRTMEEVLGLPPLNLNDALAKPMADIFNTTPSKWSFTARPSALLYNTRLPLPPKTAGLHVPKRTHDAQYWARVTKGMDFTVEDRVDFARYNRILWTGMMGNKPYPHAPTGRGLRKNREENHPRAKMSDGRRADLGRLRAP